MFKVESIHSGPCHFCSPSLKCRAGVTCRLWPYQQQTLDSLAWVRNDSYSERTHCGATPNCHNWVKSAHSFSCTLEEWISEVSRTEGGRGQPQSVEHGCACLRALKEISLASVSRESTFLGSQHFLYLQSVLLRSP